MSITATPTRTVTTPPVAGVHHPRRANYPGTVAYARFYDHGAAPMWQVTIEGPKADYLLGELGYRLADHGYDSASDFFTEPGQSIVTGDRLRVVGTAPVLLVLTRVLGVEARVAYNFDDMPEPA